MPVYQQQSEDVKDIGSLNALDWAQKMNNGKKNRKLIEYIPKIYIDDSSSLRLCNLGNIDGIDVFKT